jgi:aminobenzoyl-glutamate transport protein
MPEPARHEPTADPAAHAAGTALAPRPRRGVLDWIERLGNALPDPVILFVLLAAMVMGASALGSALGWRVQALEPVLSTPAEIAAGKPRFDARPVGEPIEPRSLLSGEGLYWAMTSMVRNFVNFPPLGVVLVAMLGVGVAEKVGLFGAVMKLLAGLVPGALLTPAVLLMGMLSHVAADAGFIVMPPLAAALYAAVGRSPIVGAATAFAGVAGGFSANLLISPSDALVGGLTSHAAGIVSPGYSVSPAANWYFLSASTLLLMICGWCVTAFIVEPRFHARPVELGGPPRPAEPTPAHRTPGQPASPGTPAAWTLEPIERRGLRAAGAAMALVALVVGLAIAWPSGPLHGSVPQSGSSTTSAVPSPRWMSAVVPVIMIAFLFPGLAYGRATGAIRRGADIASAMVHAMQAMAPVVVLAFFAAQFTEYLKYSNLDRMLAFTGAGVLVRSGLSPSALLVGLVVLTMSVNLMISSMSAKWSMLAPILVPMLMLVGLSPALIQATYRVGDSVTNTVTPLNPYLPIVLAVMQRSWRSAGLGTLVATMVPYAVVFALAWTGLLLAWVWLGWPLGPGAGLWFRPGA